MKNLGLMVLLLAAARVAIAGGPAAVPEIDATSAIGAVALFSGALLVIRGRRRAG
jgi:hypothetical protein